MFSCRSWVFSSCWYSCPAIGIAVDGHLSTQVFTPPVSFVGFWGGVHLSWVSLVLMSVIFFLFHLCSVSVFLVLQSSLYRLQGSSCLPADCRYGWLGQFACVLVQVVKFASCVWSWCLAILVSGMALLGAHLSLLTCYWPQEVGGCLRVNFWQNFNLLQFSSVWSPGFLLACPGVVIK